MADEQPSLHIDTDWKKQAQEEKRRLAEEEQKKQQQQKAAPTPPPGAGAGSSGAEPGGPPAAPGAARGRAAGPRGARELPPASFATLVQSLVTQTLFYLGDLAPQGAEPSVNLDMAKHQIDTISMLEQKTLNNLDEDEKRLLDAALYEVRMRYVTVASQFT